MIQTLRILQNLQDFCGHVGQLFGLAVGKARMVEGRGLMELPFRIGGGFAVGQNRHVMDSEKIRAGYRLPLA